MIDSERLKGRTVLVVEDEAMIAMMLEDMLADLGCAVIGPADGVAEALELATGPRAIDVALLDVNLGGRPVFEVADVLTARQVPIVFSTGYGEAGLRERDQGAPILRKPFRSSDLTLALHQALGLAV
jgi:CheY-like chemotaxis protein